MRSFRDNDLRPGIIRSAIEYLSIAPSSRPVPTSCKEKKAARDKECIEQPLRRHGYMRIAVSLHASFFVTFLHPASMNLHAKREDAHQKTPPAYTEGVFTQQRITLYPQTHWNPHPYHSQVKRRLSIRQFSWLQFLAHLRLPEGNPSVAETMAPCRVAHCYSGVTAPA